MQIGVRNAAYALPDPDIAPAIVRGQLVSHHHIGDRHRNGGNQRHQGKFTELPCQTIVPGGLEIA
ncbi:Uncharacterised protein [Salmonella enterica subsp. enterica serovar Bovismorbificans]|uniref:Uncharacterized protein n=1 Tax=Salmonella enterica subsp. enterica serovar Bovismorbificans TaxID=58097 RepID=A0A655CKX4_SALET|nr:Uncharacterised protein [Salmonella enterica subsp. enterica serovar Bovismorbificans]